MTTYAIIGAGMAGLTCAQRLSHTHSHISLWEKSRGIGGRMAQRRWESTRFDHGAQYLQAKSPEFQQQLSQWQQQGHLQAWPSHISTLATHRSQQPPQPAAYVGVPGMTAPLKPTLDQVQIRYQTRITRVQRLSQGWQLWDEQQQQYNYYDTLILAIPAPQAVPLLQPVSAFASAVSEVEIQAIWAAMLHFDTPLPLAEQCAFIDEDPRLRWFGHNHSKPQRGDADSWILHGRVDWSEQHTELDKHQAAQQLWQAFQQHLQLTTSPTHLMGHLWRYGHVTRPLGEAFLWDAEQRLGVCGDWCLGNNAESAFLSGTALAEYLLSST